MISASDASLPNIDIPALFTETFLHAYPLGSVYWHHHHIGIQSVTISVFRTTPLNSAPTCVISASDSSWGLYVYTVQVAGHKLHKWCVALQPPQILVQRT